MRTMVLGLLLLAATPLRAGFHAERPARPLVLAFCSGAAKTLDLALPRLGDGELAALLEAKAATGVAVRLLLDPGYKSNRAAAEAFRRAKFELRWHAAAQPGAMAARVLLADGSRLLTGSFEALPESLDGRLESLVSTDDASLVGQARQRFEELWGKAKPKLEEALELQDALEGLGEPRGEEELTPRIKRRSSKAPAP